MKEKSFLDLEKKIPFSMHVLKERYVKKCGKDISGSELYTLVVSFCSKHNIFSKIITR
jgi:tetrahydromethanopterin S-methyltransferase subunit G